MSRQLSFRVVGFPSDKNDKEDFKHRIKDILMEKCQFKISTIINSVGVDGNKPSSIPSLLQEVLSFIEITGLFEHGDPSFKNFIELWLKACEQIFPASSFPWLGIQDKTAFSYSRKSHHYLDMHPVHFGTLLSSSSFTIHQVIDGDVKFFHDTRFMKIYYSPASYGDSTNFYDSDSFDYMSDGDSIFDFDHVQERKCLVLAYANIRHCLVDRNKLLIVYSYPPIVRNDNDSERLDSSPIRTDVLGLSNGILLQNIHYDMLMELTSRLHFRCMELPIMFLNFAISNEGTPNDLSRELVNITSSSLKFDCCYFMEALARQKYLLQLQGIRGFVLVATSLYHEQPLIVEKAISDLVSVAELAYPLNYRFCLLMWYSYLEINRTPDHLLNFVPERATAIRRAVLTPTRVLLYPKEIIIQNRILRNFNPEFALRVSFRDDDFVKFNCRLPLSITINNCTIRDPMSNDLVIAGRRYQFLAWSNSQIKDHSVWMYAKDDKNETSASIRQWMGDFSEIKNVAKYMARMGQCFSQTSETVGIPMNSFHVSVEDDIKRGYNTETKEQYCFTDGIGKISEGTTKKVCKSLELASNPSAFQIRYGGAKGMLVLDPTLKNTELVLRKSMQKFESSNDRLEIVKYSKASKVCLNRQMIAILDHLKVDTGVLLRIQEDALETLTEMLLDSKKAAGYLAYHHNLRGVDFENAYRCGIDLSSEPFFRAMLLARHQCDVAGLKQNARLPIDPSEGRNMFGVVDETGTLEYGQVFVKYTTDILKMEGHDNTTVLKGKVLVTKNPCYMAGDVRIFQCVDVPALHHIVDCIVFPQRGHRPHPDEMSGSDLDGDEYTVIWKEELLFNRNAEPGTFPSEKGIDLPIINVSDMINFLVEFINNDRIGYIAHSHLATSDVLGVNHETSDLLARYCSIAVDFSKTGAGANLNKNLRPKKYPDFMEKSFKESYRSKRALGKLFRVCRDFQSSSIDYTYEKATIDKDLEYPGWEKFKTEAEKTLASYSHCLQQLLGTYGIKHESEAMTGAFSAIHSRFKETKDRYETEELVAVYVRALWKKFKDDFWRDLVQDENFATEALKKVSAYYVVTYSQENPTVLSLPWIFTKQLSELKQLRLSERHEIVTPDVRPLMDRLNLELYKENLVVQDSVPFGFQEIVLLPDHFQSNLKSLNIATEVLLHWAREVELLEKYGSRGPRKGFMTEQSFKKLILHVVAEEKRNDGPIFLILSFLRFCMSLRFTNKQNRGEILPFDVPQSGFLSKVAMLSYRDLAVSQGLSALHVGTLCHETEIVEMEPVRIQKRTIGRRTAFVSSLLKTWSGVLQVNIREDGKWQCVLMAEGTRNSVRELEAILRKGDDLLTYAFRSGQLPQRH